MTFQITSPFKLGYDCRKLQLVCLATAIFVASSGTVLSQPHKIVSPSFYEHVEGEGADTTFGDRTRLQQVFPAEDFASLDAGTYAITQFAWRPDGDLEGPVKAVYADVTIEMALTGASFDETNPDNVEPGVAVLSHTFADNYLTDPETVREGEISITSENNVSDNGVTKEFDQVVKFDRPFLYDPSDGNLLFEVRVHQGNDVPTFADFAGEGPEGARIPPNWMVIARSPNREEADVMFRGTIVEFTMHRIEPGDLDANGLLDVADLDQLATEISRPNNPVFDLNDDGVIDDLDYAYWATQLKGTWVGDANLDGVFDSGDLTAVFQAGKYELDENAGWSEGDWNADERFDSTDFIVAFQDGGYEMGVRPAVAAVPEPSSWILLSLGLLSVARIRGR